MKSKNLTDRVSQTRGGDAARFIGLRENKVYPLVWCAIGTTKTGDGFPFCTTLEGYYLHDKAPHANDILTLCPSPSK